MVIGSVCLPVRFAGSKQGEEQIKGQTRRNSISVQSKKHRGLKATPLIKTNHFLVTMLDKVNNTSYRYRDKQ